MYLVVLREVGANLGLQTRRRRAAMAVAAAHQAGLHDVVVVAHDGGLGRGRSLLDETEHTARLSFLSAGDLGFYGRTNGGGRNRGTQSHNSAARIRPITSPMQIKYRTYTDAASTAAPQMQSVGQSAGTATSWWRRSALMEESGELRELLRLFRRERDAPSKGFAADAGKSVSGFELVKRIGIDGLQRLLTSRLTLQLEDGQSRYQDHEFLDALQSVLWAIHAPSSAREGDEYRTRMFVFVLQAIHEQSVPPGVAAAVTETLLRELQHLKEDGVPPVVEEILRGVTICHQQQQQRRAGTSIDYRCIWRTVFSHELLLTVSSLFNIMFQMDLQYSSRSSCFLNCSCGLRGAL